MRTVSPQRPPAAPSPKRRDDDDWAEVVELLGRLPLLRGLKEDADRLRRLLLARRAPRIAVLGGRGPAVVSALMKLEAEPELAAGRWRRLGQHRLDWAWIDGSSDAAAQMRALAAHAPPDLLLWVATPRDVAAGLDRPAAALAAIRGVLAPSPPIVGVLLCDEARGSEVDEARDAFARRLQELRARMPVHVLAPPVEEAAAELASAIVEALPEVARVEAARALPGASRARQEVAATVVRLCATLAATVAVTPFPLSDVAVLAPLQVLMVTALAYLSGRPWQRKVALEWLASVGLVGAAGWSLRWSAQQLVKLLPGAGSLVSAGIAAGGTLALGRSAARYFLGHDRPSGEVSAV